MNFVRSLSFFVTTVVFAGDTRTGSDFSDYFLESAKFITVKGGGTDHYLTLQRPSEERAESEPFKINYAAVDLITVEIDAAQLPPEAISPEGTFNGKLFRCTAAAVEGPYMKVEFPGEIDEGYGPCKEVRDALDAQPVTTGPGGLPLRRGRPLLKVVGSLRCRMFRG